MKDLHSAKTLIQILKAEPSRIDFLLQIEVYLGNVETYIVYATKDRFGPKYVESFMQKMKKVREELHKKGIVETASTSSRFIPGLPREKPWMRLQISKEIPKEKLESLAAEDGLSFEMQEDSYLLVYGEKEKIKRFVKKVADKLK